MRTKYLRTFIIILASTFSQSAFSGAEGALLYVYNGDIELTIERINNTSDCHFSEVALGFSKNEDANDRPPREEFKVNIPLHSQSFSGNTYHNFSYTTTGNYPSGNHYPHLYLYCLDGSLGSTATWPSRDLDDRFESSLLESAAGSSDIISVLFLSLLFFNRKFFGVKVRGNNGE